MKNPRKKWNILLLVFLAFLCVGVVELSASYFFAPAVFAKITSPVVTAVRTVVTTCQDTATAVQNYFKSRHQRAEEPTILVDWDDSTATRFVTREGKVLLTGGGLLVEYFNQADPMWADQPYGTDNIGRYGCGPAVMAMVVSSMSGTHASPVDIAQWAVENRCWAKGSGSYNALIPRCAEAFGLTAQPLTDKTPEGMKSALLSGNLMVALVGPGHFTGSGHFILLRGVTMGGNILVADPNSPERSLMEWDPQIILAELSGNRSDDGPLWVISWGQ